jgi:hypothetical protein
VTSIPRQNNIARLIRMKTFAVDFICISLLSANDKEYVSITKRAGLIVYCWPCIAPTAEKWGVSEGLISLIQ